MDVVLIVAENQDNEQLSTFPAGVSVRQLFYLSLQALARLKTVAKVYVATASRELLDLVEEIKNEDPAWGKQLEGMSMVEPLESATSQALALAERLDFDKIAVIKARALLLFSDDVEKGFRAASDPCATSVFSATVLKGRCWLRGEAGEVFSLDYGLKDPDNLRKDSVLVENGLFYITSRSALLKSGRLVSGRVKAVITEESFLYGVGKAGCLGTGGECIRDAFDAPKPIKPVPLIKMFLTDCDGCMTDGGMYYSEKGDELKKFNTRDGSGFGLLKLNGLITGIITGENMELNRRRAKKLRLDILVSGCRDKMAAVKEICAQRNIELANVLYIGDDINDIDLMKIVGYSCAPADAMPEVREAADFVTVARGGEGVIREVAERILEANYGSARLKFNDFLRSKNTNS